MKVPFQMVQMTVTCADISGLLFELNVLGVGLHHVRQKNELTASFCVPLSRERLAVTIIEGAGAKIESKVPASVSVLLKGVLRRPVLILGGLLIFVLTFYLPTKVLFVTVSGNERIPRQKILSAASDCGVSFGAARHEIRSEKVKNQLLSALPELKWVGVNTRGCVAQISVQERAAAEKEIDGPMVTSLVAASDGVIREMTVTSGNPVCRVGQAVKKGQLLVSGYSDCGRCIYGTRAEGEIYAQTRRTLSLSLLTKGVKKDSVREVDRKYGLLIGKKRINFYKGSGISDTTCVRMYVEYPLTLPGGFQLPIALTVQEETEYDTSSLVLCSQEAEAVLAEYAQAYLESQMIAGQVGQGNYQITESEGAFHLQGQYICDEMIGQTRSEEIVNYYEQTD